MPSQPEALWNAPFKTNLDSHGSQSCWKAWEQSPALTPPSLVGLLRNQHCPATSEISTRITLQKHPLFYKCPIPPQPTPHPRLPHKTLQVLFSYYNQISKQENAPLKVRWRAVYSSKELCSSANYPKLAWEKHSGVNNVQLLLYIHSSKRDIYSPNLKYFPV